MKKIESQNNCTDYLGKKGIFAVTRDTTTKKAINRKMALQAQP